MKNFRKALSIILGLAIMLSCVAGMQVSVAAEETTPTAALELKVGTATVADGVVTVPVEVIENTGFQALTLEVGYTDTVLDLVVPTEENNIVVKNAAFTTAKDSATTGPDVNPYRIMWAFAEEKTDVTAKGTIATLTFNVVEGATTDPTNIDIEVTEAWDVKGNDLVPTTTATDGVVEFVKECDHADAEWVVTKAATNTARGTKNLVCPCGVVVEENVVIPKVLRIQSATLLLENNISLVYFVNANYFTEEGYTDPSIVFEVVDPVTGVMQEYTISDYVVEDSSYKFYFKNILPQQATDNVKATIYAKCADGTDFVPTTENKGIIPNYSIATYCKNTLGKATTTAPLKRLIADLVLYAEAKQQYVDYNLDNLATSILTSEQLALATQSLTRSLTNHQAFAGELADPTYKFNSATLITKDSVELKFWFSALDASKGFTGAAGELDGFSIEVELDGEVTTFTPNDTTFTYTSSNKRYDFIFNKVRARQLSSPVRVKVLKDGVAVSDTLIYSVEAYLSKNVSGSTELNLLCQRLAIYGDSAYFYVNGKEVNAQ